MHRPSNRLHYLLQLSSSFQNFKNIKTNSLSSKNFHQTFFIYTQISEDVQLYPESPAKKSLKDLQNRRRISTNAGDIQESPENFNGHRRKKIRLKTRGFQVRRFFVY
ncbi:hypothetical protein Hanom_Chr15g01410411 [Helianthus anomalus]